MSWRPDRERTATGYRWLDKLTNPYWVWRENRARLKLNTLMGDGDPVLGAEMLREAVWAHKYLSPPLDRDPVAKRLGIWKETSE